MAWVLNRFENAFGGFDVLDRDRSAGDGFEQVAKKYHAAAVVGKFFKSGIFSGFGRLDVRVQAADNFGRIGVKFGAFAETVETGVGHLFAGFGKSFLMQAKIVGRADRRAISGRQNRRRLQKIRRKVLRRGRRFQTR